MKKNHRSNEERRARKARRQQHRQPNDLLKDAFKWEHPNGQSGELSLGVLLKLADSTQLTTPTEIDAHMLRFCQTINPDADPFYLDVTPEPWSKLNCCSLNVARYMEKQGGSMVCGYRLWYVPDIYIEAERHAIWRSPEGTCRDVSFCADGESKIVFLPDSADRQGYFDNHNKVRHAIHPHAEFVVAANGGRIDGHVPNPATSWDDARLNFVPTFEQWGHDGKLGFVKSALLAMADDPFLGRFVKRVS